VAIGKMLVSADTRDQLGGAEGVAAVAACLWPGDCQTCGRVLGQDPPALCVDDLSEFAYASVHHPACRAPGWNDSSSIATTSRPLVSHRTRLVMLPMADGGKRELVPVMVINPALESVFLAPGQDGRWRPETSATFTALGLVPPGPDLKLDQPVSGAYAGLTGAAVVITLTIAPFDSYACDLAPGDAPFHREITSQRGILMAVTQAVDPASAGLVSQFQQALRQRNLLCGWVALRDDSK